MAWGSKDEQRYKPPRMEDEQMEALERFIALSSNANDFAKKVIIWTLRQTKNLTRPVALTLFDNDYGPDRTASVQDGAHDMASANGKTHIDLFFKGMGTEMRLGHHCGCFEKHGSTFDPRANARTIWVSYVFFDREAVFLQAPPLTEFEAIILPKIG